MKLQEQMDAFKKGFVEQVPEQYSGPRKRDSVLR